MKKLILLLLVSLFHINTIDGQVSMTITSTPATCSTCCNASFTVSFSGCTTYTIYASGLGPPTSIMGSNAIYSNVCPGSYSVTVLGGNPCTYAVQVCNIGYLTNVAAISNE